MSPNSTYLFESCIKQAFVSNEARYGFEKHVPVIQHEIMCSLVANYTVNHKKPHPYYFGNNFVKF
jgi:hypothetical protein